MPLQWPLPAILLGCRTQCFGRREVSRGLTAGWIAWAVEGFSAWQQREGLQPPTKVLTAVQQYRTETDTVGQFLDDCCKENLEAKASAKDLYDAYRGWCYSNGETALAKHELGKQLKERGFTITRTKSIRGWGGLELIETPDPVLEF